MNANNSGILPSTAIETGTPLIGEGTNTNNNNDNNNTTTAQSGQTTNNTSPTATTTATQLPPLNPQFQGQQPQPVSAFPQQKPIMSTQPFMPSPSASSPAVNPSNAINNLANMAAASPPSSAAPMMQMVDSPGNNQQIVRTGGGAYADKGAKYIDLTDYLALPQTEAARRLGIPTSTLSKRWKEAVVNRKWPYRMVCKLNKEIMTLLHNVPQGPGAPPLPPEVEQSLGILLRRRQEELRGVVIRI